MKIKKLFIIILLTILPLVSISQGLDIFDFYRIETTQGNVDYAMETEGKISFLKTTVILHENEGIIEGNFIIKSILSQTLEGKIAYAASPIQNSEIFVVIGKSKESVFFLNPENGDIIIFFHKNMEGSKDPLMEKDTWFIHIKKEEEPLKKL